MSAYRVFTGISVPLAEVKGIKNAVEGATVNDVALTIVGGAMRKYLQAHQELPDDSVVAMAPVNVRDKSEKGTGGNIVSTMSVKIRSDIDDPRERLEAVNHAASSAKQYSNAVGAKTMTDYSQFIPSTLTAQAARLATRWHLVNQISPIYNCVITNVPGPQVPLFNTGAKMISNFGTGPVADGLGLFPRDQQLLRRVHRIGHLLSRDDAGSGFLPGVPAGELRGAARRHGRKPG